ncbi:uncharacterized protein LOC143289890 [Babylonia areolata]|uniref:uncharacterized protein LOC143289890 n=1 Tax=Babylonia areolata TaxID=304850 RepID=UPI003FD0B777
MEWTALSCVVFAIFLSIKAEPVVSSAQYENTLVKERVNEMYSNLKELLKEGDSHLKKLIEEGLEHVKEQRKDGDERLKEELDEDVEWLKERQDKRRRQTEDELADVEAKTNKEITELTEAFEDLQNRGSGKQWQQPNCANTEDLMQQMSDFRSELNSTTQRLYAAEEEIRSLSAHAAPKQTPSFRAELAGPDDVTANTAIPFKLVFAVGEGDYNETTGVYTVAVPGVYSVGFQLYPKVSNDFHIDLFKNGERRIRSRCFNKPDHVISCAVSTLLRFQKGDRVWVQAGHGPFWEKHHSYFFGALISPDP